MDKDIKHFVGLDVHQDTIVMAVADPGRSKARIVGELKHDMTRLVRQLSKLQGDPGSIHVVYEAGPTGYGLQRHLAQKGYVCDVIAPSKMPQRPGERIKTDRRDAARLAELNRAGELTRVHVPDTADEAIRDLSRAREDSVKACQKARLQLKGFLLRHDRRFPGKTSWTKTHYAWLAAQKFEHVSQQIAFTEYQLAVQATEQSVQRLTHSLAQCVVGWRFEPVVNALQAMRGIQLVTAVGLIAEIGDITRFAHPRQLMGYLGVVPSEYSSGNKVSKGSITRTGNGHARRLLVEAAWHYRHTPRIGVNPAVRQRGLPDAIKAQAWKAQTRLCGRFARLNNRGVQRNKICVAVARELAGFVWAIAHMAMEPHNTPKQPS